MIAVLYGFVTGAVAMAAASFFAFGVDKHFLITFALLSVIALGGGWVLFG